MDGNILNHICLCSIVAQDKIRAEHAASAALMLVIVSAAVQIWIKSDKEGDGSFTPLKMFGASIAM